VVDHGRFKSVCCVPYIVIAIAVLLCIGAGLAIMATYGFHSFEHTSQSPPGDYKVINSVLITLACLVGVVVLANVYTWMRAVVYLALPTRKQVGDMYSYATTDSGVAKWIIIIIIIIITTTIFIVLSSMAPLGEFTALTQTS